MTADQQHGAPVVLVGGGFNTLSAARSLGRAGHEVHLVVQAGEGELASRSRYVRDCVQVVGPDAAAQCLQHLVHRVEPGSVVIPCSDSALELLARSRGALLGAGLRPAEADDQLVLAMLDKQQTYATLAALGFDVPRTALAGADDAATVTASFAFPFALKPRYSHRYPRTSCMPKALVVRDRSSLDDALAWTRRAGIAMLVTEIVPGPDDQYCSYYGYVDAGGQELFHVTKRKLRQYPVGFGTGTHHLTQWQPDVAALGRQLFAALGLLGLGNVEFKRDARDGRLRVIECNLRLTAATELVRRAGVDLADVVYRRALGEDVDPVLAFRSGLRQWLPLRDLRALRQYHASGELDVRQWLSTLAHRQQLPVFDRRDPWPSVARTSGLGRQVVRAARTRAVPEPPAPALSPEPPSCPRSAAGPHGPRNGRARVLHVERRS